MLLMAVRHAIDAAAAITAADYALHAAFYADFLPPLPLSLMSRHTHAA